MLGSRARVPAVPEQTAIRFSAPESESGRPPRSHWAERPSLWVWLALCLALAALSLIAAHSLNYDPFSWLVRAREIVHGTIDTRYGAAWKPLPIIANLPIVLTGTMAAPTIWLLVARVGTLMALAMLFRVGARLGGALAGVAAAVLFVLVAYPDSGFTMVRSFVLGTSDVLTVTFVLLAVDRHLAGRRRTALAAMGAAALVRPEAGLFLAAYAALVGLRHQKDRAAAVTAVVLVGVLWVVPDYLGSGSFLHASHIARSQIPPEVRGSDPGLAVLRYPRSLLIFPTKLGVILAALVALGTRDRVLGVLLAVMVAWALLIAGMAQAGYPGLERFLAVPLALAALLGAVGIVRLAALLRPRLARGVVLVAWGALVVLLAPEPVRALHEQLDAARAQADSTRRLSIALQRATASGRLDGCRTLATGRLTVPVARWYIPGPNARVFWRRADLLVLQLRRHGRTVPRISPRRIRRYRLIAAVSPWRVLARCPARPAA